MKSDLRPAGAIEGAVLNGFAELAGLNLRNAVEVGSRARDFQDAVLRARARKGRVFESRFPVIFRRPLNCRSVCAEVSRSLPKRLIETLEAIKLFVSVPRTAFVIGADLRIVRHAISTRYVKRQLQHSGESTEMRRDEEGLVQDYLEKLIQVPDQRPRLSANEIETYVNLLACEKLLDSAQVPSVLEAWRSTRAQNIYAPFTAESIYEALPGGAQLPANLKEQLDWSKAVASVITEGLKGNPR